MIASEKHQCNKAHLGHFLLLTIKLPIITAGDKSWNTIFFIFSVKISFVILCELSALQTIHMKWQDLSLLKKKNEECCLLQILLGALRVIIINKIIQI